jgi:acyl-CoA synthetase (AMP-forming)/AMP-acid ligase II
MIFGDILLENSRLYPNAPAVGCEETTLTWAQLNERANRLAHGLVQLGAKKGDRVAFVSKNCHQFFEMWFGLAKGGFIGVTPNFRLAPAEFSYILNDAGANVIIVSEEFGEVLRQVSTKSERVTHIVGMGANHGFEWDYETVVQQGFPEEPKIEVGENDIRLLMYTSGTSGKPKGAVWTHRSSMTPLPDLLLASHSSRRDINLNIIPLCLAGGVMTSNAFAYQGCLNVVLREFDPVHVFRAIEEHRVTVTTMVPTIMIALLNHPEREHHDLTSLEKIIYGSAPISFEVLGRAMKAFKCDFVQAYGATETNGFSGYLYPEDHVFDGSEKSRRRVSSAGYEALWAKQRVMNEKMEEMAPGEVGEILIKGPGVIREYWNAPEKSAESIRDGWWHSGDLATVDEEGYITIVDRRIDMIISGAMNIYSREIEDVLYKHPTVLDAVVIGVPDKEWGESVKAIVKLRPGETATEAEIIQHCLKHLASYKKPKSVDFVEEFPVGPGGKILKRVVRDTYWKGKERRV